MEPEATPPLWALDVAAKAAGYTNWAEVAQMHGGRMSGAYASVEAHARTLAAHPEVYKPVDEAELKRRQDAREAAVIGNASIGFGETHLQEIRDGFADGDCCVISAYSALCREHGVTPTPVSEWSDK